MDTGHTNADCCRAHSVFWHLQMKIWMFPGTCSPAMTTPQKITWCNVLTFAKHILNTSILTSHLNPNKKIWIYFWQLILFIQTCPAYFVTLWLWTIAKFLLAFQFEKINRVVPYHSFYLIEQTGWIGGWWYFYGSAERNVSSLEVYHCNSKLHSNQLTLPECQRQCIETCSQTICAEIDRLQHTCPILCG